MKIYRMLEKSIQYATVQHCNERVATVLCMAFVLDDFVHDADSCMCNTVDACECVYSVQKEIRKEPLAVVVLDMCSAIVLCIIPYYHTHYKSQTETYDERKTTTYNNTHDNNNKNRYKNDLHVDKTVDILEFLNA